MKRNLSRLERIEHIHKKLTWNLGSTFQQLARELGVSVATVHEDVGVMRKVLGLPITLEHYPFIAYTHRSTMNSDVFDLADKLTDYVYA